MTPDQLAEIVSKLLKERRLPENTVGVYPPKQNGLVFAVRFRSRVESQCLVDPEWESQASVIERLGRWLNTEVQGSAAAAEPEA